MQERLRFYEEAERLSGLAHNNVLKCLGVVMDNATDMIVLEYISEGSLTDFFVRNTHPPAKLIRIAQELAAGLSYLASCNVVHGDLRWYALNFRMLR